jgi:hypothetical protein
MTEGEILAFTRGYNTAMKLPKGLMRHWMEAKELHRSCNCSMCLLLRQAMDGRFSDIETRSR